MVIPVNDSCPISAWSPITLATVKSHSYNPGAHHGVICEFLDSVISLDHVSPKLRPQYEAVLAKCVSLVIDGLVNLREVPETVIKKLDAERAGMTFFRYG